MCDISFVHRVITGWNQIIEELQKWEKIKKDEATDFSFEKSPILDYLSFF